MEQNDIISCVSSSAWATLIFVGMNSGSVTFYETHTSKQVNFEDRSGERMYGRQNANCRPPLPFQSKISCLVYKNHEVFPGCYRQADPNALNGMLAYEKHYSRLKLVQTWVFSSNPLSASWTLPKYNGFMVDASLHKPGPERLEWPPRMEVPRNQVSLRSITGCLQYFVGISSHQAIAVEPEFHAAHRKHSRLD